MRTAAQQQNLGVWRDYLRKELLEVRKKTKGNLNDNFSRAIISLGVYLKNEEGGVIQNLSSTQKENLIGVAERLLAADYYPTLIFKGIVSEKYAFAAMRNLQGITKYIQRK